MEKHKKRRQFLKNTSLAALGLGILPITGKAKTKADQHIDSLTACEKTTLDYYGEGPFYTDNPPQMVNHKLSSDTEPGTPIIVSGRVFNLDCSEFIPNTLIDAWHANDAGEYDNQGFNLRGYTFSNDQGFYMFQTIKPGKYQTGNDFRPSHIHFKITPPDFPTLTTQLYFEGDPDLATDPASSITSGQYDASNRIIPLLDNGEGILEGTWDIVINGEGITDVQELHVDRGMIYKTQPNPFTNRLMIKYGVFRKAKIGLSVYNMLGKEVAQLQESELPAEKYEAIWQPQSEIPDGHYFIVLKVNDLQVHYQKVIRKRS